MKICPKCNAINKYESKECTCCGYVFDPPDNRENFTKDFTMKKILVLVMVLCSWCLGTTYYVSKTGNDTYGNGTQTWVDTDTSTDWSAGDTGPWLTINKALTTISSGDEVVIGDGTYVEDTSDNYWTITQDFTSETIFRAENAHSGTTWKVIIKGPAADAKNIYLNAATNITFKECQFVPNTNQDCCMRMLGANIKIKFVNCDWTSTSTAAEAALDFVGTAAAYNWQFIGCSFNGKGTLGVIYANKSTRVDVQSVQFLNCTITSAAGTNSPLVDLQYGFKGLVFDTCTFTHTGTSNVRAITIGVDGASASVASPCYGVVVRNCTISTTTSSHALLVGAPIHGARIEGCNITAPNVDYAIVIKTAGGAEVRNNLIVGGRTGIISRASYGFEISNNTFYCDTTGINIENYDGSAPTMGTGGLGRVYNNIVYLTKTGNQYGVHMFNSAGTPNCYIDYNCLYGTGTFYPLRVDTANKTLAQSLTFWATYGTESGRTTNYAHSVFTDPQFANTTDSTKSNYFMPLNGGCNLSGGEYMGSVAPPQKADWFAR